MKKFIAFLILFNAVLPAEQHFPPDQYLAHIKYLASDELKGRGNNQPELEKAAGYIEKEFRRSGLKAFPSLNGYRQFFEITAETRVGARSQLKAAGKTFRLDNDFSLLSFSDQVSGETEAVFCGYGIDSADAGYNDYAGKEVRGRVVVVLDGYPKLAEKQERVALLADTNSKIVLAKNQGASALAIVVEHPGVYPSRRAERMGIISFAVTAQLATSLLGAPPDQWNNPHASLSRAPLTWNMQIEEKKKEVANVVGYLPAAEGAQPETSRSPNPQSASPSPHSAIHNPQSAIHNPHSAIHNPQSKEWLVVGAHYDHLGLGEKFALDPKALGQPHNGADDNASGTAAVLCLARELASNHSRFQRGIIFVAFAGEELGLLGSGYFVKNLPAEAQHVVAMVNMDMIGRSKGKIYLGGVGTAQEFGALVTSLVTPLKIETSQSGLGGSDHMSFTVRGIPALFFFSGLHSDYHKATDDWQKINVETSMEVLDLVGQAVAKLAASTSPLHFVAVAEAKPAGGGSGYGAYFGSIPDFAQDIKGVRFSDVRQGSPAQKAGLRAGDVLVRFDGKPIENLYDFTFALRSHAPGQTVEVECIRDGKPLKATVTLEKRQ
ncbi:MAG TPA: M20/M25/M40 family metallo-hydrolase [Acidobacteriota bacterium]|jgi:hypothetical protein